MNLSTLQTFLEQTQVPEIKANPKTFLGIARQPHYENVMSNIYAFFFDVNEEHGLKDLFVSSLTEIISEKTTKEVSLLTGFDIVTEYPTKNGGRIDLLLWNENDAIIIENKVYHILNNDLNDYWESIPRKNKSGVILSLIPITSVPAIGKPFTNILHYELLQRVMCNLGPYLLNANDKYLVYLKDFYQNTINLSSPMNRENVHFYYKNQDGINTAYDLRNSVLQEIKHEVEKVGSLLGEEVSSYSSRGGEEERLKHFTAPNNLKLTITIVFEQLLHVNKKLTIMVKLYDKEIEKGQTLAKGIFTETEQSIIQPEFYQPPTTHYANFAERSYDLSSEDIVNLSSFITGKIKEDGFLSIFRKLNAHITAINAKAELN